MKLQIDKNSHKVFFEEIYTRSILVDNQKCLYRISLVLIDDKKTNYVLCDISSKNNSVAKGKLFQENILVTEFTNQREFNNIVFDLMKGKAL